MQFEKVKGFFADIEKEKWSVAVGGTNEDKPGYFITPTIIDNPADDARIAMEEPFGKNQSQVQTEPKLITVDLKAPSFRS